MDRLLPKIGITMGDPTGIGPEIVLKAVSNPDILCLCNPVVLGDKNFLEDVMRKLKLKTQNYKFKTINLSNLDPQTIKPGKPDRACGRSMAAYIKKGVEMALEGEIDALVTAPINKELLNDAGLSFPGHTEFIANLTNTSDVCMMLVGERLKVSLVTTHYPLRDVPELLTGKMILKTILLTHRALVDYFGFPSPRIAVASLNPHGGEKGLFGKEEREIIQPAVKEAINSGVDTKGPFPSDTLFYKTAKGLFDAVVAMYHDQGLIPIKLLSFGKAVNVTVGLPIIRASVDHGTAYDIAGKGVADPSSLLQAITMAVDMVQKKRQ